MKRGFTLLELMVASLLLAMLITILTMIFNQSSIAWTVGTASLRGLGDTREKMATLGNLAEKVVDPQKGILIASVWNRGGSGLNTTYCRALMDKNDVKGDESTYLNELLSKYPNMQDPSTSQDRIPVGGGDSNSKDSYLVGVTSYGPDGKTGGDFSWDDITTMPLED